ncbi:MAG: hypothetical protein U0797_19635 [Gemmataceae bacterium]
MASFLEMARELAGEDGQQRGPLDRVAAREGWSANAACRRIRPRLERNHVFVENAEIGGLAQLVLDPTTWVCQTLRDGFHRLVVLDARKGLRGAAFDLEEFLRHAQARMAMAFGLSLPEGSFHAENVTQVLKDEPRSLFCFVNVQLIPVRELRRLRGFTQEQHQALFLCCGTRNLHQEEAELDETDSDSDFVLEHEDCRESDGLERWFEAADLPTMCSLLAESLRAAYAADRVTILEVRGPTARVKARAAGRSPTRLPDQMLLKVAQRCLGKGRAVVGAITGGSRHSVLAAAAVDERSAGLVLCLERGSAGGAFSPGYRDALEALAKQVRSWWELYRPG